MPSLLYWDGAGGRLGESRCTAGRSDSWVCCRRGWCGRSRGKPPRNSYTGYHLCPFPVPCFPFPVWRFPFSVFRFPFPVSRLMTSLVAILLVVLAMLAGGIYKLATIKERVERHSGRNVTITKMDSEDRTVTTTAAWRTEIEEILWLFEENMAEGNTRFYIWCYGW